MQKFGDMYFYSGVWVLPYGLGWTLEKDGKPYLNGEVYQRLQDAKKAIQNAKKAGD